MRPIKLSRADCLSASVNYRCEPTEFHRNSKALPKCEVKISLLQLAAFQIRNQHQVSLPLESVSLYFMLVCSLEVKCSTLRCNALSSHSEYFTDVHFSIGNQSAKRFWRFSFASLGALILAQENIKIGESFKHFCCQRSVQYSAQHQSVAPH